MGARHHFVDRRVVVHPRERPDAGAQVCLARLVGPHAGLPLPDEVAAGPQPGDRREVVGGHRRQRVLRERARVAGLEVEQPVRQHAAPSQVGSHPVLHRPEVLAHDERLSSMALDGEDVEEVGGGVAHVGAFVGPASGGHPEEAEQAHHVVDAQPTRVAEPGADGLDERLVAGGAQSPRVEREQSPVLAAGVELVGRGPDRDAVGVGTAVDPSVGSVGVDADGEVVHEAELARRELELAVERPLHPHVEAHAIGIERARARAARRRSRSPPGNRPAR